MIRYWPGQFVFIPASLPAICIDVLCLLFVLTVLVTANRQAHSVSNFLYAVFPYVATTFLLREWPPHGRARTKRRNQSVIGATIITKTAALTTADAHPSGSYLV